MTNTSNGLWSRGLVCGIGMWVATWTTLAADAPPATAAPAAAEVPAAAVQPAAPAAVRPGAMRQLFQDAQMTRVAIQQREQALLTGNAEVKAKVADIETKIEETLKAAAALRLQRQAVLEEADPELKTLYQKQAKMQEELQAQFRRAQRAAPPAPGREPAVAAPAVAAPEPAPVPAAPAPETK